MAGTSSTRSRNPLFNGCALFMAAVGLRQQLRALVAIPFSSGVLFSRPFTAKVDDTITMSQSPFHRVCCSHIRVSLLRGRTAQAVAIPYSSGLLLSHFTPPAPAPLLPLTTAPSLPAAIPYSSGLLFSHPAGRLHVCRHAGVAIPFLSVCCSHCHVTLYQRGRQRCVAIPYSSGLLFSRTDDAWLKVNPDPSQSSIHRGCCSHQAGLSRTRGR